MNSHSAAAFAPANEVRDLAVAQGQHTSEIANVKESMKRIEEKLDRLIFLVLGSLATGTVGLMVSLFRH